MDQEFRNSHDKLRDVRALEIGPPGTVGVPHL